MAFSSADKRRQRARLLLRHGCECWLCGEEMTVEEMTLDHVIPRSFGGSNRIENLRLAHSACNEKRGCDFFGLTPLPTSRPNQFAELFKELCATNT